MRRPWSSVPHEATKRPKPNRFATNFPVRPQITAGGLEGLAAYFLQSIATLSVHSCDELGFRQCFNSDARSCSLYAPVAPHRSFARSLMVRGVIFDLFHTLTGLESESVSFPSTNEVLGIEPAVWNKAIAANSRWRLAGEVRDPIQIVQTLAHQIDPNITLARIGHAAAARTARAARALQAIPDTSLSVLAALRGRGLQLGLISNLDQCEFAGWSTSPLRGLFDAELFSCEVGMVKPEPAVFRECLNRMGLAASECIYVGDGGGNELQGARAVGLYTVLYTGVIEELWPERIPSLAQSANAIIGTLLELTLLPVLQVPVSHLPVLPNPLHLPA